jgi:hypothetical protein
LSTLVLGSSSLLFVIQIARAINYWDPNLKE